MSSTTFVPTPGRTNVTVIVFRPTCLMLTSVSPNRTRGTLFNDSNCTRTDESEAIR